MELDAQPLPDPVVHSLEAPDGWILRVYDYPPAGTPRGVVVAGHAMMVDARTISRADRASLASQLVEQGFRVLVPDLRGHGNSGPLPAEGGEWTYDDLVNDVGVYVELAQALEPDRPLALLGHSLFGHCALAWLGQHPDAPVRSVALLAVEVWNKQHEARLTRWWLKRLLYIVSLVIVGMRGYMPARALRLGSADEASAYWYQFNRMQQLNAWCSFDTRTDYAAGLERVVCPVLHVASEADWLYANPRSALQFTAPLPTREVVVCGRDDAPGALHRMRPDHMGMLTSPESQPLWRFVGRWLLRTLAEG